MNTKTAKQTIVKFEVCEMPKNAMPHEVGYALGLFDTYAAADAYCKKIRSEGKSGVYVRDVEFAAKG